MPEISVITPTYNCAQYLPEALDSLLNQTYQDFEIVVIDDGSRDNTKDVISEYCKVSDKIKYFYQPNKGLSNARNKGIKLAKGQYVTFLDADDTFMPRMLEKTHSLLSRNKECDAVLTEWHQIDIDNKGQVIGESWIKMSNFPDTPEKIYNMVFTDFIFDAYMTVRKTYLEKIGNFDERLSFGEDVDIWRRFAKHGIKIDLIKEPLFVYRKRQNSITTDTTCKKLRGQLQLINKYKQDILSNSAFREYHSNLLWDIARKAFYMRVDIFFIMKCAILSQIYKPSISRVSSSLQSMISRRKYGLSYEKN